MPFSDKNKISKKNNKAGQHPTTGRWLLLDYSLNSIILHKNNRIIKDNKKISHTSNKYFTNLTKTLKLKKICPVLKKKSLKHLLRHFKNHSPKRIKKNFNSKEIFTFCEFQETEIIKIIQELPQNMPVLQRHSSENYFENQTFSIFADILNMLILH